ncbi:hypothetical protein KI688_006984 [Linnemannia hyalina]|uniref:Uncharacterized protein n=1 Tax=Linnemannia hyalina TaxID=64524 RepID=A0A9P7XJU6_9FUNG|nr:hypothetical protein KI688_006984 [Linnemannia hyalina]
MPLEPSSNIMGNSTNTNTPSTVTTTIATTDTGNGLAIIAAILQSELDRKLTDLKDIREAYAGIIENWTDDRPEAPTKYCHTVQVCWAHAIKMWQYQHRLQEATAKIEGEIAQFRKEMLDALVRSHRSGSGSAAYSE